MTASRATVLAASNPRFSARSASAASRASRYPPPVQGFRGLSELPGRSRLKRNLNGRRWCRRNHLGRNGRNGSGRRSVGRFSRLRPERPGWKRRSVIRVASEDSLCGNLHFERSARPGGDRGLFPGRTKEDRGKDGDKPHHEPDGEKKRLPSGGRRRRRPGRGSSGSRRPGGIHGHSRNSGRDAADLHGFSSGNGGIRTVS